MSPFLVEFWFISSNFLSTNVRVPVQRAIYHVCCRFKASVIPSFPRPASQEREGGREGEDRSLPLYRRHTQKSSKQLSNNLPSPPPPHPSHSITILKYDILSSSSHLSSFVFFLLGDTFIGRRGGGGERTNWPMCAWWGGGGCGYGEPSWLALTCLNIGVCVCLRAGCVYYVC